jgi:outer membrane lipoprotein-sorting protein
MKKLALAVLVALLVATVVVAGCGKKESKAPTGAQGILAKSQEAVKSIKSFKGNGSADLKTPQSESKEAKYTYNMQEKIITSDDLQVSFSATQQNGQQNLVYVMDGYMYSYSSAQGWEKQKVASAQQVLGTSFVSPDQISKMSKYAQNLKKLPDEGNNYVLSFSVSSKFFENALSTSTGSSSSSSQSKPDQSTMDLIKGLLQSLSMKIKTNIDKTTYYPSSTNVAVSIKDAPLIGNMSVAMDMTFSDYNAPVTITLPPEAQAAKEVAPSATGLPTIPGLGL